MALNITVPLASIYDELDLISSELPNSDNRDKLKLVVSPIGSESSGVSSLDSEEIKKSSTPSSPVQKRGLSVSSTDILRAIGCERKNATDYDELVNEENRVTHLDDDSSSMPILASPKPKHPTSSQVEEIIDADLDISAAIDENNVEAAADADKENETTDENDEGKKHDSIEEKTKPIAKKGYIIGYNGRNILDLGANITNPQEFVTYSDLPKHNFKMIMSNRSQYHRLDGHKQEYALVNCSCCDFYYPDDGYYDTSCNDNFRNAKKGGSLGFAIYTFLSSSEQNGNYSPMMSPPIPPFHYYQQNMAQQANVVSYPPTFNDLLNTNFQQQQQMATVAALLSATNKENTLNSLYGSGTNNATTALSRLLGNNSNNIGNWENGNAILNNGNNSPSSNHYKNGAVQNNRNYQYVNQGMVPPSNYYKHF